ncbi:MAG: acetyl-CoA carboxylase biotin carboxyl carrier protein subunit [Candidatus Cloacimonadota bacterium]|nr:MAG: acetyl-CoA carboxylase biotin carboxyl carrier protein subunit [Candidatus Cloacimonadota bacterium]PIE78320.1 MAG: acetyl-CoA carboxylase biotin carboxyl carrier protein subunit [Candidatus Delongbacteria bacterium]
MKKIVLEINGKEYTVEIDRVGQFDADLKVNHRSYHVGLKDLGHDKKVEVVRPVSTSSDQAPAVKTPKTSRPSTGDGKEVTAPLPGLILSINVKPGDKVKNGQVLLIMEAMKMENEVVAEADGVVKEIKVKTQESVIEGDTLLTLE